MARLNAGLLQITNEDRLRGIIRAYRVAQKDERAVLPTYLSLLIEAAALALADRESAYANGCIKRDQLARNDGDAANDMSVAGTHLRPGT